MDLLVSKELETALDPVPESPTPTAVEALSKCDKKALFIICSHVSDSFIHFLDSGMTALEAWNKLLLLNSSSCHSRIRSLYKELVKLNMKQSESVNEYVARAKAVQLSIARRMRL
jgi:hypothetical protein